MADDTPDVTTVRAALAALSSRQKWNTPSLGTLDMLIRKDGSWWHEGSEIKRPGLVRLFAGILRRRDGRHELVTPVECWQIGVEDSAFVLTDWHWDESEGERILVFRTNVGESFLLEEPDAFRLDVLPSGEPRPYVGVRDGLEARVPPIVYYQWLEEARFEAQQGVLKAILVSAGRDFCLGEAPDPPV